MAEKQLMRRAFPVLLLVLGAASGCNCKGDVSNIPDGGTSLDGGPDAGPDGGPIVNPCEFIYCPPSSTDGGPVSIGFGNLDGGQGGFTLDGGTAGSMGNGVTVDPMGRVTLSSTDLQLNFALIANWTMGTVSKYDTKNLLPDGGIHELARYISVIPIDGLGNTNHSTSAQVYNPSRTAIDINTDFWVANFSANKNQYFSATKIAGNTFDCIDRNGNGVIDTSFDNPATPGGIYGVIDPSEYANPKDPTNVLEYDECVLFTQELGNINPNGAFGEGSIAIARGIEGAPGDVWVGTWIDRKVFRLDPETGVPKPVYPDGGIYFPVPDIEPYGAAVDALNRLWVVGRTVNTLALINANDPVTLLAGNTGLGHPRIVPPGGIETGGYGIAVDGLNRVWIPAWAQGPYATVFTPDASAPTTGTWTQFNFTSFTSPIGTHIARPRGIATDVNGTVWMTSDSSNNGSAAMVFGIDGLDGGSPYYFATDAGPTNLIDATDINSKTSIGIGLDQDGNLWVNNNSGNVMRVDRNTGAVIKTLRQAGQLYSYSDFTGYQLRHITTNQGSFYQTVAGCSRFAQWNSVMWDATTPPNTSIVLYVRGSNNFDFTLSQQYGPWLSSPANLQGPPGPVPQFKYLQLQFVLVSQDQTSQPYLNSFSINTSCNTPIN
jgi:hypothetical protein